MLTKVEIKNYRGFPSYRMEGLTQVNLLVGKNNSGKTALLEGAQFLLSGGDPSVLEDAAQRRGELVILRSDRAALIDPSHFFHGHILAPDAEFSIGGDNGYKPVQVRIAASKGKREEVEPSEPRSRYSRAVLRIDGGRFPEPDAPRVFRITREGGVDLDVGTRPRRLGLPRLFDGPAVRFIGTDSLTMMTLGALWDEVQLNGSEEEVAAALRVLESEVSSVHMLTGMSAYGYYSAKAGTIIGLKGKQRVPLGSMGDGMRRMLSLATSLACTSGGALFVDEIDTGLHYSVMRDMWRLVVERAAKSGVQVFATTHSWDCIEGLSLLCQEDSSFRSKASVQKIDRTLTHSIPFSGESVARMERHHIDPR